MRRCYTRRALNDELWRVVHNVQSMMWRFGDASVFAPSPTLLQIIRVIANGLADGGAHDIPIPFTERIRMRITFVQEREVYPEPAGTQYELLFPE